MIPNISTYSRLFKILRFKKISIASTRNRSHLRRTVAELRQIWTDETLAHMCRLLGRDIRAYKGGPQNIVGDVLVQTCRVVGTDHYIPLRQVCMATSSPIYTHIAPKPVLLDTVSGSLVDVSWQPMRAEFNNTITAERVQCLLSSADQDQYGQDLLRIHVISAFDRSQTKSLYFSTEDFLDRCEVTKQWLNTVADVARSLSDVADSHQPESEKMEDRLLSLMASSKMALLGSLDLYWKPDAALWQLENLTDRIQKLASKADGFQVTSRKVVKDLCVLVNILAPYTAHKMWDQLTCAHLPSTDNVGSLDDATWPEDGPNVKVNSFVYITTVDSNGKSISFVKATRPTELIANLKEDDYIKILTSGKGYKRRFESLKMEVLRVSWVVGETRRWVDVDITVQASSELDNLLATLGR